MFVYICGVCVYVCVELSVYVCVTGGWCHLNRGGRDRGGG